MQRTADAVSRHRTLSSDLVLAWGTDVQLLTLPLSPADAQRVLRVQQRRARSGAEPFRGAARIGLGLDRRLERRPLAITFRRFSVTAPDGSITAPIAPDGRRCRLGGSLRSGGCGFCRGVARCDTRRLAGFRSFSCLRWLRSPAHAPGLPGAFQPKLAVPDPT